jgi:tetratricopeptide (TPR) repeat protein
MTYSGNPSLSRDVQQRVLDTFGQTLDLADEGSRQEALLGCDFVLRMDAQFEPARKLQERLRSSAGAIVDTGDLRAAIGPSLGNAAAQQTQQVVPAELFADLDGLGLELPDLAPTGNDLHSELQALLDLRRFQQLMSLAEREQATVMADPVLQGVVQEAQSRMEAEPYVKKFLASARAALDAGNDDETARLLDKARALDASHPEIAEIDAARRKAGAADAGAEGFDLGFDSMGLGSHLQESSMPAFDLGAGSDSDPRVRALLDEGQKAFDAGDLQGSIDAWSRIFLIDIDHQEASRRIDQARKLKAESERQVEEIFHEGVGKLEAGDAAGARQAFQRVIELQPGYFAAREYLQQLDAGKMPVPTRSPSRDAMAGAPESLLHLGGLDAVDDLKEEILVPPEPGGGSKPAERRPAKVAAVRERRPGKLFAIVGSVVLVAALGGGWFVWQNKDRFFPNSRQPEEPGGASPATDPIARATALHKAGKDPRAVDQLRRVSPSDPRYQQAQDLIKQWGGGGGAHEPGTAQTPAGPATPAPPAIPPERLAALDAAHKAYAEGSYIRAAEILDQAANTGRLDPGDEDMLARAKAQIEPLAKQIELFKQHEWEYLIHDLWRIREKTPSRDVDHMLIDSYYDLGVRDLQRADAVKAADKFKEALNLAPNDPVLKRHMQFAQTYQERQKDLLYKIYVKYLTYR